MLALGLAIASQLGGSEPEGQTGRAPLSLPVPLTAPGTLTPQPPGEAPPGKVWSPEHGRWHDAATATPDSQ